MYRRILTLIIFLISLNQLKLMAISKFFNGYHFDSISYFSTALNKILLPVIEEFKYPAGIAFLDLNNNEKFLFNENEIFPTASAIKIEILLHLLKEYEKGKIDIYENIRINSRVGGSGILQYFDQNNLNLSYYNLALLMIQQSDNTATNILIDTLGMENINKTISDFGLINTRLQRKMLDFEARRIGKDNISTPSDKLKLLEGIYLKSFLSDTLNNELIKILSIPKSTPLLDGINEEVTLASKGGELSDVRCDMGIFLFKDFNYILVVMTKNLPNSKIGEDFINRISNAIFSYMKTKYEDK